MKRCQVCVLPETFPGKTFKVTGIFFDYYMARKAAALDPIEALRSE